MLQKQAKMLFHKNVKIISLKQKIHLKDFPDCLFCVLVVAVNKVDTTEQNDTS